MMSSLVYIYEVNKNGSCIDNVRLIPIGPKHGMISPLTIYMEG